MKLVKQKTYKDKKQVNQEHLLISTINPALTFAGFARSVPTSPVLGPKTRHSDAPADWGRPHSFKPA